MEDDGTCICKARFLGDMCNQCIKGYNGTTCEDCSQGYYRNNQDTCSGNQNRNISSIVHNGFFFQLVNVILGAHQ